MSRLALALPKRTTTLFELAAIGGAARISTSARLRARSSKPAAPATAGAPDLKPAGYRLCTLPQLRLYLEPLNEVGWRMLDQRQRMVTPHPGYLFIEPSEEQQPGDLDLQGKRLVRAFQFRLGQKGWHDLMYFTRCLAETIDAVDHHPSITISPVQDYLPVIEDIPVDSISGYIVEVSTHTHSPLPPSKAYFKKRRAKPGLTGKDLELAEKAEALFAETVGYRRYE